MIHNSLFQENHAHVRAPPNSCSSSVTWWLHTINLTHAVTYTWDHTDTVNMTHVIKTKKLQNVTRFRDSRSASSRETRYGWYQKNLVGLPSYQGMELVVQLNMQPLSLQTNILDFCSCTVSYCQHTFFCMCVWFWLYEFLWSLIKYLASVAVTGSLCV